MENMEGSEGTGTKISDSAYSNSCGNSQSHRSGSSKSRHSGSNSSGSSGYGGKGSSSATNSNDATQSPTSKRTKEKKNKKSKSSSSTKNATEISTNVICGRGNDRTTENEDRSNNLENTNTCINDINDSPVNEDDNCAGKIETISSTNLIQQLGMHAADHGLPIQKQENDNTSIDGFSPAKADEQTSVCAKSQCTTMSRNFQHLPTHSDGFSCVVSMCEGVVLYTNSSITHALGYPQDMWLGKSFIDFIHPKDRSIFGSRITSGVASAFVETSVAENSEVLPRVTLYCRIRKYHGIASTNSGVSGYGVREREVYYTPFQLNLSFRDAAEFDDSNTYLVIKAYALISPYADGKLKCKKFTTRHTATGLVTHVEPVTVLGYLPQDVVGRNIFDFYHPDDLPYLKEVYENITKSEKAFRSKPYRFCTQNGDYLTVESDWSTFINPWSRKIEFVICCHYILQPPCNLDVFQCRTKQVKMFSDEAIKQGKILQDDIIRILAEKRPDCTKTSASKRCEDMAIFMERLVNECDKPDKELKLEVPEDTSLSERDSVMLGEISPHHDYCYSKSSTETPPSYNQLNYNENLQRFFESRPFTIVNEETLSDEKAAEDQNNDMYNSTKDNNNHHNSQRQNSGSGESGGSGMSIEKIYPSSFGQSTSQQNITDVEDYKSAYLTEELLHKHNTVMEKILVKKHRDERSLFKAEERDKGARKEKKLTSLRNIIPTNHPYMKHGSGFLQGVKRSGSSSWEQQNDTHKITKLSVHNPEEYNNLQKTVPTTAVQGFPMMSSTNTTACIPPHMSSTMMATNNGQNPYSSMYPAVYLISSQQDHSQDPSNFPAANQYPVPYMMYPPTMFTSQPFLYAPHMAMPCQPLALSNPVQQPVAVDNVTSSIPSIGLPYNNYQQACQVSITMGKRNETALRNHLNKLSVPQSNEQLEFTDTSTVVQRGSLTSPSVLKRGKFNRNKNNNLNNNRRREVLDNDESSYSSFLKTETSNSTDGIDSGGEPGNLSSSKDKESSNESQSCVTIDDSSSKDERLKQCRLNPDGRNKFSKPSDNHAQMTSFKDIKQSTCHRLLRNQNPPWMDEISVTPDLDYRYQVSPQNVEDVLKSDFRFLKSTTQPTLVNEQLSQLYMELQLDGLSEKLTLEEGFTSNSSSEEESVLRPKKNKSYSKLVMIYEEDAPIPSPVETNNGENTNTIDNY